MADIDIGKTLKGAGIVVAAVGAPALGGQAVSGFIQSRSTRAAQMGLTPGGQFILDLVSGLVVGAAVVGVAAAIGGKSEAIKTAAFAVGGAAIGAAAPVVDLAILSGMTSAPQLSAPAKVLQMTGTTGRSPGGLYADAGLGGIPGGLSPERGLQGVL